MSFDSSDSGPLAGYSSNRDPVYHSFNLHLINHMGNPDQTGNNSTQNTDPTIRNDEEQFTKELNSFNSKIQEDDIMKVTALAKTWMSNLRRISNIKKDFDKTNQTKNSSNIAYSRIISDSTSNDEAKYLIDIVEEEISKAEHARNKTSEILTLLEAKVEAMSEAEVGNNDQLRNEAPDIIWSFIPKLFVVANFCF